jgi:hypothetical protein
MNLTAFLHLALRLIMSAALYLHSFTCLYGIHRDKFTCFLALNSPVTVCEELVYEYDTQTALVKGYSLFDFHMGFIMPISTMKITAQIMTEDRVALGMK